MNLQTDIEDLQQKLHFATCKKCCERLFATFISMFEGFDVTVELKDTTTLKGRCERASANVVFNFLQCSLPVAFTYFCNIPN